MTIYLDDLTIEQALLAADEALIVLQLLRDEESYNKDRAFVMLCNNVSLALPALIRFVRSWQEAILRQKEIHQRLKKEIEEGLEQEALRRRLDDDDQP